MAFTQVKKRGKKPTRPVITMQKNRVFYINGMALLDLGTTTRYVAVLIDEDNREVMINRSNEDDFNSYFIGNSVVASKGECAKFGCSTLANAIQKVTDEKAFRTYPTDEGIKFNY